jgi:hypothetical protein
MIPRRFVRGVLAVALASAFALTLVPASARAQCNYPFMASGSTMYFPFGQTYTPTVVQPTNYWSVVAVRPDAGSDWDLAAYSTAVLFPTCVSGELASSVRATSSVDLIIGDFNHNPTGTFYVRPYHFGGGGGATVEWDDGPDVISVNAPRTERATGPADVVEVWDVFLIAGQNYSFDIQTQGTNHMQMHLFKNPANAPYWNNRSGAMLSLDFPTSSTTVGNLTVDQTDYYGLVMINENGGSGVYRIRLETCTPPTALASGVAVTTGEPRGHWTIQPTHAAFTAVGVRSSDPATQWMMELGQGTNAVSPSCYANFVALSAAAGEVSYVVGDYTAGANVPGGFWDVTPFAPVGSGVSVGKVEWDHGAESIVVNAAPIAGTTDASDVLTSWDVSLEAGRRYQVEFLHGGAADLKLALFDNPGAAYWVPRSSASVESATTFWFDAPRTDVYGLVLANDNGQAGTYQIAVKRCDAVEVAAQSPSYLVPTPAGTANRFRLDVPEDSWAGILLLPLKPTEDWTLDLYADRLGAPPLCFSNLRKTSNLPPPGKAEVIAGHPNFAPSGSGGEFFARATAAPGTTDNALFQWEQGTDALVVGASAVSHNVGSGDNLRCFDVGLVAGVSYDFIFAKTGSATPRMLLFRPEGVNADGLWKSRAEANFDLASGTTYVAPVSGIYGLVVVNDNGALGSVQIGVTVHGSVAVDPAGAPLVTKLERIVPHPVAHDSRIHYALAHAGDVSFEIVNAAGRRVAEIAVGPREAGRWSADWTGASSEGGRALASGVYFVRMKLDGVRVADARLVHVR